MTEVDASSVKMDKEEETVSFPLERKIGGKHPLQNSWTLWFFKQDSSKTWEESQIIVASFDTIEDFWSLYNHIEVVSKLKNGYDYSLFKEGIKPMWEDPANRQGGRWIINLSKQQRATELDAFWMETILLLIGEGFDEDSDEVCGAVANLRGKGDKVAIWTRDAKNMTSNVKIGEKLKRALHLHPHCMITFQSHSDASNKRGSVVRSLYEV